MRLKIAAILLATTFVTLGAAAAARAAQPVPAAPQAEPVRYSAQHLLRDDGLRHGLARRRCLLARRPQPADQARRAAACSTFTRLPVAGGDPVPLTASTTNANFAESYFPGDDRAAFPADQGGNELNHLYVRLADGTVRDLTPGEKLKAEFDGWSADGRTLFVSTNERNPQMFDLYAYDAQTYARRLVFQNEGFLIGAVSRDGRQVALIKAHSSANSDVYLAEIGATGAAGAPR